MKKAEAENIAKKLKIDEAVYPAELIAKKILEAIAFKKKYKEDIEARDMPKDDFLLNEDAIHVDMERGNEKVSTDIYIDLKNKKPYSGIVINYRKVIDNFFNERIVIRNIQTVQEGIRDGLQVNYGYNGGHKNGNSCHEIDFFEVKKGEIDKNSNISFKVQDNNGYAESKLKELNLDKRLLPENVIGYLHEELNRNKIKSTLSNESPQESTEIKSNP